MAALPSDLLFSVATGCDLRLLMDILTFTAPAERSNYITYDKIDGNIVIEVIPSSNYFTTTYRNSITHTIPDWEKTIRTSRE